MATDVGDSREIVADDSLIVPARDPSALAAVLIEALQRFRNEPRRAAGDVQRFGLEHMVERTERELLSVATAS